jgi:hypothetical protein
MAKLTESYLRGMIKQAINEMHDMGGSMSADPMDQALNSLRRAFEYLNDAALTADPETKGSIDSALRELMTVQEALSSVDEDYMLSESRKSRTAPRRKVLKEEFSQQENQILTQARNLGKPDFANAVADYLRSKDHVTSGKLLSKIFSATVGKKDLYDVYKKTLEIKGHTPEKYHASNLDFRPPHPYDMAAAGNEGSYKY